MADQGINSKNVPISTHKAMYKTAPSRFRALSQPRIAGAESLGLLDRADSLGNITVVDISGVDIEETLQSGLTVSRNFIS